MTNMDRTARPEPAASSRLVFVRTDRTHDRVEIQLLANGDLRLLQTLAGYAVEKFVNESAQLWQLWLAVKSADVPLVVADRDDVLEAVVELLAPRADDPTEDGFVIAGRFAALLDSKGIRYTSHEFDDYD